MFLTILLWIASIVAIIIVLAVALCLPPVRTALTWVAVFFVTYAPSIITIIVVLLVLVILPIASLSAVYGLPVLIVLFMLAIFAIWSSFAKWLLWDILIVGLLISFFYQPASNWLHKELPALTAWQETSREASNIKIQESSLSMKDKIENSRVTRGTWGHILKDGIGYDDFGSANPNVVFKKDDTVKSMGKIKPQNETGDEGLVQVMRPNKHGDFVGGEIIWIPIQKVAWEKQIAEEKKATITSPPPPPPAVVPQTSIVTPPTPVVAPTPPPVQKVVPPPQTTVHVTTPEEYWESQARARQAQPPPTRRVYYPEPWHRHEPPRHHDRYYRYDRW